MTSRNHIRVVAVALVSAPHAAGAGAAYLTPPQAGATGETFLRFVSFRSKGMAQSVVTPGAKGLF